MPAENTEEDTNIYLPYDESFLSVEDTKQCLSSYKIAGTVAYLLPPGSGLVITRIYVSMVDRDTNEIFANNVLVTESTFEISDYEYEQTFDPPKKTRIAGNVRVAITGAI